MSTNPFYNALCAIAYIISLVSIVIQGPRFLDLPQQSMFYPILALSVLVLSVALMAYLFFYQPVILLLEGERVLATKLFLNTVALFALSIICTVLIGVLCISLGIV